MATITQINPDKFSIQDYTFEDYDIVPNFEVTSLYMPESGNIEFFVYDANNNLLSSNYNLTSYSFTEDPSITNLGGYSTINLDPEKSLIDIGLDVGQYNVVYNFFENQLGSSSDLTFYLKEISSDRTELRLSSNNLVITPEVFNQFSSKLQDTDYFNEFYLNFGKNKIVIAINTQLDGNDILVKLYEPLPSQFPLKTTCWVTLKVSDPLAYNISLIKESQTVNSIPFLKGPNTNIQIKDEINNSTDLKSYEELISTTLTSSFQQINNLLSENGIEINVDYTDYNSFIFFSSAEQRLLNFYEKVSLIESSSNQLNGVTNQITGSSSSSYYVSESRAYYQNIIDNTIKNFDGYEYFLYFDSSSESWPKSNSTYPYTLYSTGSSQVLNWLGSSDETSGYYGGQALSASFYDNDNPNNLIYTLPEFLRDDPTNVNGVLFTEMLGQHFDNIWIYIKDVTNKFNADNRLNYGVSKDLVAQAIRDLGLKIYQNQFAQEDLFSAFLGITPSGSLLPSTGSELITSYVTASSDVVPLDDANKAIYKRLYHNLPYLLNKKGTIQGIKALIASYGIPNTILRVSEFGGKDRDNSNDWDYWYNKFNYAFETSGSKYISSSFSANSDWSSDPTAVEFRFKAENTPPTNYSQSIWSLDGGAELTLEYTGSGLTSGSYSGSVVDEYYQYGTLHFKPTPTTSASVYLPFFDNGWWSIAVNKDSDTYELIAKNKIYIGDDASLIGFQASSSVNVSTTNWSNSTVSTFANGSQENFSGSLQEIRYYTNPLTQATFDDYVMNPLSIEGNSLNSSPVELIFRAPLGAELEQSEDLQQESVHPKITGSWTTTESFASDSYFHYSDTPYFAPNTEYIFLDQPASGIKNRINDKVRIGDQLLPTGSNQVLSQYRSIEQQLPLSQSYTPNINQLEVAFSPQNEINDDIIESLGYFNVGNYIGDPRYISSSRTDYEDLSRLSNEYFQKYTHNYDVWDYIRLIKYFDNSLFKMIKDFVPAKTSLQSGVVIKQHLLERNRYPQPQMSWEQNDYSGSIEIGTIDGSAGGSVNKYNELAGTIENFTQSYSETLNTIAGTFETTHSTQDEFYNGEYSGSTLVATTQSLNPECGVYLHGLPDSYNYSASIFNTTESAVTTTRFIDSSNTPMLSGYTYFLYNNTNVSKIRISKTTADGTYLGAQLAELLSISTISELGGKTYNFTGVPLDLGDDYLYSVSNTVSAPTSTSNNIINIGLYIEESLGSAALNVYGNGATGYQITQGGTYNGLYFFPLDSTNLSVGELQLSEYNPFWGDGSNLFDISNSNLLYHYSNDSLLDIQEGRAGGSNCNVKVTNMRSTSWTGNIMFALVAVNYKEVVPQVDVIWEDSSQNFVDVTSVAKSYTSTLQAVAGINEETFVANYADDSINYYWGVITGSTSVNTVGSIGFGDSSNSLEFDFRQKSNPNTATEAVDSGDTISHVLESSSPTGFTNSDCDVLQGNSEDDRASGLYMDVDYSSDASIAVNSVSILSGSATKADVQDSNYTLTRHINPRYNGSRTTSPDFNTWNSSSINTYGKLATADQEKTYFAYFDFINGLSPELKNKSIAHIQFLVDEEGNAIPPDKSKLYITQGTFKTGEQVLVNLNDPSRFEVPMNELNGSKTVVRGGQRVDALLYTDSGSSYVDTINFDTGSFSVNDYQFGTQNTTPNSSVSTGFNLYTGWNNDTLANAQWSNSTDTFTFSSDTNSPVKFTTKTTMKVLAGGGTMTVYIVKNWDGSSAPQTSVPTSPNYALDSDYFGGGGNFTHEFNLDTGYKNFDNGDTVKVVYYSAMSGTVTWNTFATDVFASQNQINPNGSTSATFWTTGSNPDTWLTASVGLSGLYGGKQLDVIPYDGTTNNPEFDPIIQNFTVQVGDEIRFQGAEAYARMVSQVVLPSESSTGRLYLKLDNTVPTGSNADHFLLRRYVDDASYVILDTKKPIGSTSPGTMKPEYVTDLLEENFPKATEDIIKSIT